MGKSPQEKEDLHRHNQERIQFALIRLDRLLRERLAVGVDGTVGLRIACSRGKLGPIWEIREDKLS